MKRLLILLVFLTMATGIGHAQESLDSSLEDQVFWTQHVDGNKEWGQWLKNVYKPYSDKLGKAILKIVSSTIGIDPTGKSSEELVEEVNAAYNRSLKSMETIKPPVELKIYHSKIVELYRRTINADPLEGSKNSLIINQLSIEVDQEMTKAFQMHGVPQEMIDRFIQE